MVLYTIPKKREGNNMVKTVTCVHCRLDTLIEGDDAQIQERLVKLEVEIKRLKPFESDYTHISRQLEANNKSLEHARQTIAVIKQLLALAEK